MSVICERFDLLGSDSPDRRYKLGIFGGTFDPIHMGHLACAEEVRDSFQLDAVIFVPTAHPVFKRDRRIAPARDRYAMVKRAVEDNPYFDVSPIEIERGGDTYTVDTLRQMRDHYPSNVDLFFIAGADAVSTLAKWRDEEMLGRLATFIGVTRPGFVFSAHSEEETAKSDTHIKVSYLEVTALAISSSGIRERLQSGRSVRYLVPDVVNEYIADRGLYR